MADDGHSYVVRFGNNFQHPRVLVNELIASVLLRHLQISTPHSTVIKSTDHCVRENPDVYCQLPNERRTVTPGCHCGSRYPVDVGKESVYDYIPKALRDKVFHCSHVIGPDVIDKWLANSAEGVW